VGVLRLLLLLLLLLLYWWWWCRGRSWTRFISGGLGGGGRRRGESQDGVDGKEDEADGVRCFFFVREQGHRVCQCFEGCVEWSDLGLSGLPELHHEADDCALEGEGEVGEGGGGGGGGGHD